MMKFNIEEFANGQISTICKAIKSKRSIIIAFSGGVDSSVVTALAYRALGNKALAVTIDSPLLTRSELDEAKKVAKQIGISHLVVKENELRLPEFAENPRNRCYFCKKNTFKALRKIAEKKGFEIIADGTNLSDLGEYRPGLKAAKEEDVYSPLLEAGLNKVHVRLIAKFLGLPTADKPSNACLASRVPYGQKITSEKINRIAAAESYIKKLTGVKTLRVRDHEGLARIEVGRSERRLFNEDSMDKITRKLKKFGYRFVTLDLQGYRSGSFDS